MGLCFHSEYLVVKPQHHLGGLPSFVGSGFKHLLLFGVCMGTQVPCGRHVEVRSKVRGVGFLLPCGSWVLNSVVGIGGKHLYSRHTHLNHPSRPYVPILPSNYFIK